MRKLLLLAAFVGTASAVPQDRKKDSGPTAAILTYSAPCTVAGADNWVLVTYESGFEEMMTRVKSESTRLGAKSAILEAEVRVRVIRTVCTMREAGATETSRVRRMDSGQQDADLTARQDTLRVGSRRTDADLEGRQTDVRRDSSRTDADQKSGSETTRTESRRTDVDQEGRTTEILRTSRVQGLNLVARTLGINPQFYRFVIDQLSHGNLVIWAKQMLTTLESSGINVKETMGQDIQALQTTFIVDQKVSIIKVVTTASEDRSFDDLAGLSGIEGSSVVTYAIQLKNTSEQPVKGIAVIDVLPEGFLLEEEWLTDELRRKMTLDGRLAYEIYKDKDRSIVVWGLRDPLPAKGEVTITFGVVMK